MPKSIETLISDSDEGIRYTPEVVRVAGGLGNVDNGIRLVKRVLSEEIPLEVLGEAFKQVEKSEISKDGTII